MLCIKKVQTEKGKGTNKVNKLESNRGIVDFTLVIIIRPKHTIQMTVFNNPLYCDSEVASSLNDIIDTIKENEDKSQRSQSPL